MEGHPFALSQYSNVKILYKTYGFFNCKMLAKCLYFDYNMPCMGHSKCLLSLFHIRGKLHTGHRANVLQVIAFSMIYNSTGSIYGFALFMHNRIDKEDFVIFA